MDCLKSLLPFWEDVCRGVDFAPGLFVEAPATGLPDLHRVAKRFIFGAGAAVDGAEQGHDPVCRGRAMLARNQIETVLDIAARDRIDRLVLPVAQITIHLITIELIGARLAFIPSASG